MKFIFICIYIR